MREIIFLNITFFNNYLGIHNNVPHHTHLPFLPGPYSHPCIPPSSPPRTEKEKKTHQVQFMLHIYSLWHCQTLRGQALKENWVLHPHQGLNFIIFTKILKTSFNSFLSELFLIRVGGGWNKNLQCLSFLL